jgi:hypothetical protein
MRVWAGFIWLRTGSGAVLFEEDQKLSGSVLATAPEELLGVKRLVT